MKSKDIRRSFVDFFVGCGHEHIASAPLVPREDPSLLFVNAGMVQFKEYFLGVEEPPRRRAVTVQKCLRVSGKHNDLENVGPSPRHHTFFEMLGNFSFGDYFKEEAIKLGWKLVTEVWGLEPQHLSATVYEEDDEAFELWQEIAGLPVERIHRCGADDNFWAMGETGPCGPCSELYIDRRPGEPQVPWQVGADSGRYLELWNLVFMQFERSADGELEPLPNPSIDTGAGLERLAAVLQDVDSNYDTDLFRPILDAAAALAGTRYGVDTEGEVALRVIADHLRAVAFLLADGVIPGNEGRGYVLRRLLRRAVRHGMRLGFEEAFLHRLIPVVGEVMGEAYPELDATRQASVASVRAEEEKFLATVAGGARQIQDEIEKVRSAGEDELGGSRVFRLYDTYGIPIDLIREIAEEERMGIDEAGFERALEERREESRRAAGEAGKLLESLQEALRPEAESQGREGTPFEGYGQMFLEGARVKRLARFDNGRAISTSALTGGESGAAVLDRTVFYAETGGQVGDQGWLRWRDGRARVADTQRDGAGTVFHLLEVEKGRLTPDAEMTLEVDAERRLATERNHTATHLLHAALRQVLGESVRQAGSLVAPDRLRFDFTYAEPLSETQQEEIEDLVQEWIRRAVPTEIGWRGYKEALAAGAMALFGEKYGERVRTVEIPGYSLELCGGCHVRNTGEVGLLVITSERGIASGVRRIEALTGGAAYAWLRQRHRHLEAIEAELGVPAERVPAEIEQLRRRLKEHQEELSRLRLQLVSGGQEGRREVEVNGVRILAREVPAAPAAELRNLADALRSKLGSGVVVVGSRTDDKVSLVAAVSEDLKSRIHAGRLVQALAQQVGGSGGGRPDFAQAGGKEPGRLPELLASVPDAVREQLGAA